MKTIHKFVYNILFSLLMVVYFRLTSRGQVGTIFFWMPNILAFRKYMIDLFEWQYYKVYMEIILAVFCYGVR